MRYLNLTLPSVAENIALDSALLDEAEAAEGAVETLRVWESPELAVVVGRSSRFEQEVDLDACRRQGIPVMRRDSGGAAVVIGPGCLMYAVVIGQHRTPGLRRVDAAHCHVLGELARAIRPLVPAITCNGTSDLAVGDRKVSGNSLRIKRRHILYHGTLLYDFPLDRIAQLLRTPPRMPDYRDGRPHGDFVANLPVSAEELTDALRTGWRADQPRDGWPRDRVARLVTERYLEGDWCAPR